MAKRTQNVCFLLLTCGSLFCEILAEPPVIGISSDGKLKRQNENGGEEVDLTGIDGPTNQQPGQQGQPGIPQQPNGLGQPPFFGNGYQFYQQPFFGNGFGYPGVPQQGFPQAAFGQNYPQNGFNQGYPQFGYGGRNIILQNNGKQFLVQPLTPNQRIVQKNGKQYLLQPLTGNNAAFTNGFPAGLPIYNSPNALLSSQFNPNAALTSIHPGALNSPVGFTGATGFNPGSAALTANNQFSPYSPAVAAVQPSALATNQKPTTQQVPQRLIVNSNGQKFQVEQLPIQPGQISPYFSSAVGAVSAQLASQLSGQASKQQYAYQYYPLTANSRALSAAYSRANEAGYGQFSAPKADSGSGEAAKRESKE